MIQRMLNIVRGTPMSGTHRHDRGLVRREFLQVGFSALAGIGLSALHPARAATGIEAQPTAPRARSLILVFLTGGPSHIDTLDPKPDAPADIRGPFATITTKAPGLFLAEHLPLLAQRGDRLAVVRSLTHGHANHLNATHQILTGQPQPGAFFDKIASRDDYPCYASGLQAVAPRPDGLPTGVAFPTFLMEGPLVWPGQNAGFLGPRLDPWHIKQDPNDRAFRVDALTLPDGFTIERLRQRESLAQALDVWGETAVAGAASAPFGSQHERARTLLASNRVARAFRIEEEPDAVRDRYGRHLFGQSLLLARRLVEAGVQVVQANMGRVQNWDTHDNNFDRLQKQLLPPLDQGVAALLDDLAASGLLDETLLVVAGEFGRTPRIGRGTTNNNANPTGRDHWPGAFSAAFAGAGVVGGRAIGASDKNGAYPAASPFTPADFAATIYQALGVPAEVELRDRLDRPVRIVTGRPIEALFAASVG
jgi:uncharacterized protein (DUF1501 family)